MNNKNYFSHDSGAHNDQAILKLRMAWGWEGYGIYWAIVEILRDEKRYELPSDPLETLSFRLSVDTERLVDILTDMTKYKLFTDDGKRFYSETLKKRMHKVDERYRKAVEAGKKGGIAARGRSGRPKTANDDESSQNARKPLKLNATPKDTPTVKVNTNAQIEKQAKELYGIYPRKIGKAAAMTAIKRALSKADYMELLEAVQEYANSCEGHPDKTKIPHPSTWFNQERWEDDRDEWKRWKLAGAATSGSVANMADPFGDAVAQARKAVRENNMNPLRGDH